MNVKTVVLIICLTILCLINFLGPVGWFIDIITVVLGAIAYGILRFGGKL